uniref:Uncharacterized protein n=1 Tax=viral metagenome TaxID=1070528 RepID=A0A6C0H7Q8_9ZZZZ
METLIILNIEMYIKLKLYFKKYNFQVGIISV